MKPWSLKDIENKTGISQDQKDQLIGKKIAEAKKYQKDKLAVKNTSITTPWYIFLPFNVPSSKNSKQWKGKHIGLVDSDLVQRYREAIVPHMLSNKLDWLDMISELPPPYIVTYKVARSTRQQFDQHNVIQVIADLMEEYGWIDNDNADNIRFYPLHYFIDRENPGIYLML